VVNEYRAMVVTDLDGTLFQRHHQVSGENLETLRRLGEQGVLRVIATGRNLFSARKVLSPEFPVDLVVFSSGAGIMDWGARRLIRALSMRRGELKRAFLLLRGQRLDFMVHHPVPDNHRFVYYPSGRDNPDFRARVELYREFARPGADGELPMRRASQLLAVEPRGEDPGGAPGAEHPPGEAPVPGRERPAGRLSGGTFGGTVPGLYPLIHRCLPGLNVVRTTSPLDGRSRWIEIFSRKASKAGASQWLARRYRIPERHILALGNDFNDLDLLEWAPQSCLVGGAAAALLGRFPQVSAGGEADFSLAVARWQEGLPR
jgi:hydroxymethylpyrimidine pyrophosphatase-like HAD family hydrolase